MFLDNHRCHRRLREDFSTDKLGANISKQAAASGICPRSDALASLGDPG